MLGLLSSQKTVSNERLIGKQEILSWIIDSGASHHMTGTRACLRDVSDIVSCSVEMPNGEATVALKEGTVHLGGGLKLQHVLFVPNLKYNLISVSQLLNNSNLVL